MRKYLKKSFLDKYENKNNMGMMGEFVYLRTYTRYINELGRRERWKETCERVVNYSINLERDYLISQGKKVNDIDLEKEAEFMFDNLYHLRTFTSGRTLYMGGTEIVKDYPLSNFNCAFTEIKSFETFSDLFYLLMVGSGVGLKVTKECVSQLPKVRNIKIKHIHDKNFRKVVLPNKLLQFNKGIITKNPYDKIENTKTVFKEDSAIIYIGDSKEGWKSALDIYFKIITSEEYDYVKELSIDYSAVRPAGEILKRFGGRASGHESLLKMFKKINIVTNSKTHLSSLDCLDIATIISENVVSGGVRRSALILLCDENDKDVIEAKKDLYFIDENGDFKSNDSIIHRTMSNNSILFKKRPTLEELTKIMESIKINGEPGFINEVAAKKRKEDFEGCNPCGEILLTSNTCCNLCTNNLVSFVENDRLNKDKLKQVLKLSTRIGLRMTLVDVELPNWDKAMKEDRVIGVSLTGMMDMKNLTNMSYEELGSLLKELREVVHMEGERYCKELGISVPKLMTTIKPEGSISTLPEVSSGVHFSHAPYYVRRVRIDETDPLYQAIAKDKCYPVFNDFSNPKVKVVEFPMKSPKGKTKYDVGAIEQLELYKLTMENWTDHNTSITVHVRDNEWEDVTKWVYDNFDSVLGVTFLSLFDETYPLLPFEKISEEDYNKRLKEVKPLDLDYLEEIEKNNYQEFDILDQECAGGACPIR